MLKNRLSTGTTDHLERVLVTTRHVFLHWERLYWSATFLPSRAAATLPERTSSRHRCQSHRPQGDSPDPAPAWQCSLRGPLSSRSANGVRGWGHRAGLHVRLKIRNQATASGQGWGSASIDFTARERVRCCSSPQDGMGTCAVGFCGLRSFRRCKCGEGGGLIFKCKEMI